MIFLCELLFDADDGIADETGVLYGIHVGTH